MDRRDSISPRANQPYVIEYIDSSHVRLTDRQRGRQKELRISDDLTQYSEWNDPCLSSTGDIHLFTWLRYEHQKAIERKIKELRGPEKVNQGIMAEKQQEEREDKLKVQSDLIYSCIDNLKKLKPGEIESLRIHNKLVNYVKDKYNVYSLGDAMAFGVPEKCPECERGPLLFWNTAYVCTAPVNRGTECIYSTRNPKRRPFKIPVKLKKQALLSEFEYHVEKRMIPEVQEPVKTKDPLGLKSEYGERFQKLVSKDIGQQYTGNDTDYTVYAEKDESFSAVLIQVSIAQKQNSYYKIQLLKGEEDPSVYRVFRVRGRIGTDIGESSVNDFDFLDQGKDYFEKKFLKKTGIQWADRKEFQPKRNLYHPVWIGYGDEALQNVITRICDSAKEKKLSAGLDDILVVKIHQAKDILVKLDILIRYDEMKSPSSEQKEKLSEDFYRLVPHCSEPTIKTKKIVERKQRMLNDLALKSKLDKKRSIPLDKISKQQLNEAGKILTELESLINSNEFGSSNSEEKKRLYEAFYRLVPHHKEIAIKTEEKIEKKKRMLDGLLEKKYLAEIKQLIPVDGLSEKRIKEAREILTKLSELIRSDDINSTNSEEEKITLNEVFYTLVPHYEIPIIAKRKKVEEKIAMLDNLLQRGVSFSIINTDLSIVKPADRDYEIIRKYMKNTNVHVYPKERYLHELKIWNLFKFTGPGKGKIYEEYVKTELTSETPNIMLLWYGAPMENIAGILSKGLKPNPGDGSISFTDLVSRAFHDCGDNSLVDRGIALLLLCEVALGDLRPRSEAKNLDLPNEGFSIKGLGSRFGDPLRSEFLKEDIYCTETDRHLPYNITVPCGCPGKPEAEGLSRDLYCNQYDVYSGDRVKIRYLVEVAFNKTNLL